MLGEEAGLLYRKKIKQESVVSSSWLPVKDWNKAQCYMEGNEGPWEGVMYRGLLLRVQSSSARAARVISSQIQNLEVLRRSESDSSQ